MTNTTDAHPLPAVLIFVAFIGAVSAFFWLIVRWLPRKISGWDALAARFPAGEVHKSGGRFRGCSGYFGKGRGSSVRGAFVAECAPEGLCLTANFARRLPLVIPWSAIREIQQVDTLFGRGGIIIIVDYASRVHFHLPRAALPELQKYVPADRFQAPTSLMGMIKDRLQGGSQ